MTDVLALIEKGAPYNRYSFFNYNELQDIIKVIYYMKIIVL